MSLYLLFMSVNFLLGVLLFTNTNSAAVFPPPFCGIAQTRPLPLLLVCRIRHESMAKAKCWRETNCVFQGWNKCCALAAAALAADTLYYRISTGIQALVLAVHKLSMVT
jgi:hypothetical protein